MCLFSHPRGDYDFWCDICHQWLKARYGHTTHICIKHPDRVAWEAERTYMELYREQTRKESSK